MAKGILGNRRGWTPHNGLGGMRGPRPQMGAASNTGQDVGLAILSALSITSVWSAVCPSFFTLSTFASRPEARDRARKGCWIGFGLSTLTAAGIYLYFKDLTAGIFAQGTALALLGISMYAINGEPPADVAAMDLQPEAAGLPSPSQTIPFQPSRVTTAV